jgi:hypothetical protein
MFFELVNHMVHVFYGNIVAHETQEPAVYEGLGENVEVEHMLVEVVDFYLKQFYDVVTVAFQVCKSIQVDCPQFFDLHQFDKRPESFFCVFDVVQKNACNHIHTLDISHLMVIYAISNQYASKHSFEMLI